MQQNGNRIQRTYWVEPGWGVTLKTVRVVIPQRGGQTRESYVLISRTRGPA